MTDMEINVSIDKGIKEHPKVSWLRSVAEQVLTAEGVGADAELGLVMATQERVRELNRSYRGKDASTDVLAFAMTPDAKETGLSPFIVPPDGVLHLGEVIISYPQAVTQARQHRHSIEREIAILIIHGVLHLLGYDHEAAKPRRQMRAREKEILSHIEAGLE